MDAARISDAESKMLLMLPAQQPEFISVSGTGTTSRFRCHFEESENHTVDRVKRMDASTPGIWPNILVALLQNYP